MNIQTYITGSVIFHIAFIILIGMATVKNDLKPAVFEVDLTAPFETQPPPRETEKPPPEIPKPPPVKEIPPPQVKQRLPFEIRQPKPLPEGMVPESLKGAGAHEKLKVEEKKDQSVKGGEKDMGDPLSEGSDREETSLKKDDLTLPSGKEGVSIIPPSALFDRSTIQKYARKGPAPQKGLSYDVSEFRHRGYMRMLVDKIEYVWKYPEEAARLGRSGDLYIRFEIQRDGSLGEIELLRTSGFRDLDEAAIKALKDGEPYWPLPDDYEEDILEIRFHFIYVLGSSFMM